jgi:hypothetical protein
VTATLAALELLFGTLNPVWPAAPGLTEAGNRRRYRSRQASNASPGQPIEVRFTSGESWTYRVTGPHLDFINQVLHRANAQYVEEIVSPRGTEYVKEIPALVGP